MQCSKVGRYECYAKLRGKGNPKTLAATAIDANSNVENSIMEVPECPQGRAPHSLS